METRKTSDTRTRFKSEILAVCEELAAHTVAAMEAGEWPLVIGGDHSIAMGTVSGIASHLKKSNQKLGLIWFDAHGDMNLPESTPSGNIHGMPLAHLLGYGDKDLASIHGISPAVDPENVVLIGIRDIDQKERDFINASGVKAFSMRDIDQLGPGTGTTVPGGVSFREAHLLLEECAADGRILSLEVVELNPFLDHANVSAERAVTLIQSALGRSIL
jgi:arginase